MSFATEASKLLTNKYFLYFMVFLAATNVLGYLVTNKINAVIFFALVGLLTHQFSKNMAVILLVSIIATNFLMSNKNMREGLENPTTTPALSKIEDKDPQIAAAISSLKNAKSNEEATSQMNSPVSNKIPSKVIDTNNSDLNSSTDNGEIEGAGEKMGGKKGRKEGTAGPRLDYAATIEESYANLDNVLGGESIQRLTADTHQLMQKQTELFKTMESMVPVLEGAQNMLKGFDINSLTNSLKGIGGISKAPIAGSKK